MDKVQRLSNTPISTWPRVLVNGQVALLLNRILAFQTLEAMQVATEYTDEEAMDFINANLDLIAERA